MSRSYTATSNRMARRAGITPVGELRTVSRETDVTVTQTADEEPAPSTTEDGTEITYRELQQQAKAAGISAKQSREELEAALGYD